MAAVRWIGWLICLGLAGPATAAPVSWSGDLAGLPAAGALDGGVLAAEADALPETGGSATLGPLSMALFVPAAPRLDLPRSDAILRLDGLLGETEPTTSDVSTEETLAPSDLPQPVSPIETRSQLRPIPIEHPVVTYRGEARALAPFGAGLLGLGALGGRRRRHDPVSASATRRVCSSTRASG